MILTSFRRLEVFVEAVEAGSFQTCADRLGISQASVSSQIRALEEQIGKHLFARKRGASGALTEEGGRTYALAKELIQRAQELSEGSHLTISQRPRRRIAFAIHPFLGRVLSRPIARFAAAHPDINIIVETIDYDELVHSFAQEKFDLGFFFAPGELIELESIHLWTEPVGLYASATHPLSALATVRVSDLLEHNCIPMPSGQHLQKLVDGALAQVGLSKYRVALESEHAALTIEAINLDLGYACLFQRHMSEEGARTKGLTRLPIDLTGFEVRLAVQKKFRLDRTVQKLVQFLATEGRRDLAVEVG